jgi:subtilisin family serine protease
MASAHSGPLARTAALSLVVICFPPAPASADEIRDLQWHLRALNIAQANSVTSGDGVVIAGIDSHVDGAHPDLAGAILPGLEVAGQGGRKPEVGHGTAMAGVMVARGRPDSSGVLGIASRASFLPIEIETVTPEAVAAAIDLAVERNVDIICAPLAVGGRSELEDAVNRALAADIVIVASAGNRVDASIRDPAGYPGVVASVGTDRNGEHAEVSVSGPEAVLAAPAVDIVSTKMGGGYEKSDGTSNSAAIIAGVAALVRSKFPQLSAREVVHRMTATATDKGRPGRDEEYGYGIVNPVAALTADVPPLSTSPPAGSPTAGALPPKPAGNQSSSIGWIVGALLLAAAGVGAAIAVRRAARRSEYLS